MTGCGSRKDLGCLATPGMYNLMHLRFAFVIKNAGQYFTMKLSLGQSPISLTQKGS